MHSFLNGNYVTLSGAKRQDLDRAVAIGLSPLFISVHATDATVRSTMLRNRRAPPILEQLSYLSSRGIAFHTQIVVCPGYNDRDVLEKTIRDLFGFKESLLSIAVVPVGLTSYRKVPLRPVDTECAQAVCAQIGAASDSHAARDDVRKLFCADEFFIKAGLPIPARSYYEDYRQIENGVGLVRQLMEAVAGAEKIKIRRTAARRKKNKPRNFIVATSSSAFFYVNSILQELQSIVAGLEL